MRNRWLRHALRWLPAVAVLASVAVLLLPGFAGLKRGPGPEASRPPSIAPGAFDPGFDPVVAPPPPVPTALDTMAPPGPAPPPADASPGARAPQGALSEPVDCIIEPFEMVQIGSPVTGVIEKILVERGDTVEAGQVLAQLEAGVERAAVELARARAQMQGEVKSREARFKLRHRRNVRADELFERNALSLDEREQLETDRELARLEVEQAHENQRVAQLELKQALEALERRTIRSPIAGIVVERLMSPGEVVDEETILTVAQIDPLRVEVILPAGMFGSVDPGAEAQVSPELEGAPVQIASVAIVDRIIDAASGTFGVRLELPNPDYAIPGGLHCQVRFRNR